MILVFYSPRFYPLLGGLERVVEQWADYLTLAGNTIQVITNTASDQTDEFAFPVYRNLSFYQQYKLMRQADAVVQFNIALKGLPVCILSRKPLVISHHTLLIAEMGRTPIVQKMKLFLSNRLPVLNIACSKFVARQFSQCSVVYSPYDSNQFYNQQKEREKNAIIFVGRLVTDKGADILLNAMFLLMEKEGITPLLTIVGEGPEQAALQQLALALKLDSRVQFLGKVSGKALAEQINSHEVMVVPSRVEPFGITVLEGLACGGKVLTSNSGGLPEAGGGFATQFISGSAEDLAIKLAWLMYSNQAAPAIGLEHHLHHCTISQTATHFLTQIRAVVRN